jgi:hypothetical protein
MIFDLDTMSRWLAAPARHVAEAPAGPDAHDITMKNRLRGQPDRPARRAGR